MLSLLPIAEAAPTVAHVSPGAAAKAVHVLAEGRDGLRAANCNDAGIAPDTTADGRWTCDAVEVATGDHIGLLRDGVYLDAGSWAASPGPLVLVVRSGMATLGSDVRTLPEPRPGLRAGPGFTVLARVEGLAAGAASPVVRLAGPAGSTELSCHDDGAFPDLERNDGAPGCIGIAPDARVSVGLNGGAAASMGEATWADRGPLRYLAVNAAKKTLVTTPFAATIRTPGEVSAVIEAPAPVGEAGGPAATSAPGAVAPDAVGPDAVGAAAPAAPPPGPTPGPVPTPPPAPTPTPPPAHEGGLLGPQPDAPQSPGPWRWPALAVTAVLGAFGGWAWRGTSIRVPRGLALHPSPALWEGGPVPSGPLRCFRAAEPDRFAEKLVSALARSRRVLLVARPDHSIGAVAGGPVYVAKERDRLDVEGALRALHAAPGAPVAVVLLGAYALEDPGAATSDPLGKLAEGAPGDVWIAVVLVAGEEVAGPVIDV